MTNQVLYRKKPERTCLGCRKTFEKSLLIRIVRTPEGQIVLDGSGKMNGRGAYCCRSRECIAKVLKSGALERSLRCRIPSETADSLLREVRE